MVFPEISENFSLQKFPAIRYIITSSTVRSSHFSTCISTKQHKGNSQPTCMLYCINFSGVNSLLVKWLQWRTLNASGDITLLPLWHIYGRSCEILAHCEYWGCTNTILIYSDKQILKPKWYYRTYRNLFLLTDTTDYIHNQLKL